jgi:predicted DNA-binding protein (UPF0251 family)
MSAALVILPLVQAMAAPNEHRITLLTERRARHRLVLVQASAAKAAPRRVAEEVVPEVAFYRKYTEAMLRRYQTMSTESGRVPSLLGRPILEGRVTSYKVHGFDDVVIFVHDVGRCLECLTPGERHLIRRIALQQYTQAEAAALLGLSMRTTVRRYAAALDRLTELFLDRRMLEPLRGF